MRREERRKETPCAGLQDFLYENTRVAKKEERQKARYRV
jgi:hypothetical protein